MFTEPSFNNVGHRGWIEVITGPMFSGKTEELFRRIRRSEIAGQRVTLFKPGLDNRYSETDVVSHNQNNIPSIVIKKPMHIFQHLERNKVIGIDEAQFFDDSLIRVVQQLALNNIRVIIAGLDMDFKGNPFHPMPEILATADFITKVHAICMQCGSLATHSFRKTSGEETILPGSGETYEPRCRKCFITG